MNLIIVQTIIIALIALLGGIIIGIALAVNESKTPDNPMTKMYNNFLSKQPRK